MENELRVWLRLCIFFGIYIKPRNYHYPTAAKKTNKLVSLRKSRHTFSTTKTDILRIQRIYISLIALMVASLYLHGLYRLGPLPNLLLTWLTSVTLFNLQIFTNFLILMEALCRRRQHAHFLQLLEEIEVSLKLRLRCDVRKCVLIRELHYLIAYLGALSAFGLLFFMITTLWLDYIGYFWNGLWSIMTARVRIIQLLVYVRTLQHYLECLCVKLRQIVAYRLAPQQQLLDIDYGKLDTVEYLLAVKEIYALIHKAFQFLNYFGGWSLFGIVITFLLDVSFNLYWTLLSLDGFFIRRNFYIAGPLAIIPRVIIIFILCSMCNKCKELGHNVAYLVSKMQILSSAKSMASYRLVLEQFSAQLQIQRISVTAQGFFVLEMQLLMTIITEVATNLVILLQFLSLWMEYFYNTTGVSICHSCQN